jgi:hypothetical protein
VHCTRSVQYCTDCVMYFSLVYKGDCDHVMPGSNVNMGSEFITSPKANSASKSKPQRGPPLEPRAPAIIRSAQK